MREENEKSPTKPRALACIIARRDIKRHFNEQEFSTEDTTNVRYDAGERLAHKNKLYKSFSSVISQSDETDKKSEGFYDCPAIIIFGTKDKREVSLLVHADFETLLDDDNESRGFRDELETRMKKMNADCDPGSVEACFLAGSSEASWQAELRPRIVQAVDGMTQRALRQQVRVMHPGTSVSDSKGQAVYIKTQLRRIYVVMPSKALEV